ncbi:MAG: hypothetical protein H7A49_12125 [Akkermansiaceae bacterium]|nr:hypothetical protein [Akkermansiaceae bacterium]
MNPESSYPSLRFLSEWSEIRKGKNRLPHWDANRIACFITFRLADSLPLDLLKNWHVERDQWIKENPRPWDHAAETEFHKRFSKRIDGMLDRGYGSCLLADGRFAKEVSTTLAAKDAQQYFLHSWVIMPNHVHA